MFQFPLRWPQGWPVTPWTGRSAGPFQTETSRAIQELYSELEKLGADRVVIFSNLPLSLKGAPLLGDARSAHHEPGVALHFMRRERPYVMAQDSFTTIYANLRSIGLSIKAMRTMERHGGAQLMGRAFEGFAALPPPARPADWRDALGMRGLSLSGRALLDEAERRYRDKIKRAHPDLGGTHDAMAALNVAIDNARRELEA